MLRRLAFSFAGIVAIATVVAGCASGGATQTVAIGPTFAPASLYASNATQNGISIYAGGASGTGPTYQISTGGSASGLNGPQYLAFDSTADVWTTNWQASSNTGAIVEIKANATGNVTPYNGFSFGSVHPRGIADFSFPTSSAGKPLESMVIALVDPTQPLPFSSQLQFISVGTIFGIETIAGPNTGLNVPSGVAVGKSNNIYVTNLQGASVEVFNIPSPSPTPSPTTTPSPSPSPSPTATPTGATPSPTPTPIPTATPVNVAPASTLAGAATGIHQPTGIALDTNGNIYVSDQASTICGGGTTCPAILIFTAGASGNVAPKSISGAATLLFAPTDVKVDSSGKIYVADSTASGAGVIYVYASGATGNVAPTTTLTSPGSVIGLGLTP